MEVLLASDLRVASVRAHRVLDMNGPTRSAVIVTVPSAEHAVGQYRAQFDSAAALGVPAHVTVLFPFVPPHAIDAQAIEMLATAIASVPRFHATFETTGWFGTKVLWVEPQPADRFQALTTAVANAFPAHLPYAGEHDEVIPHLTVGHGADEERLRHAEKQVLRHLPIRLTVTTATLWCGTDAPGSWQQVASLPLAEGLCRD